MSRGPGSLQKDVLDRIKWNRGVISWDELKESFPLRVENRSLHRAVRGLKRMRFLREVTMHGRRTFVHCSPQGRSKADRELAALTKAAQRQLKILASARGIRLEPSRIQRSEAT